MHLDGVFSLETVDCFASASAIHCNDLLRITYLPTYLIVYENLEPPPTPNLSICLSVSDLFFLLAFLISLPFLSFFLSFFQLICKHLRYAVISFTSVSSWRWVWG